MSKKIKVPYEYSSQFFGNRKRFRWFEVTVPDNITREIFLPDLVPHSATRAQVMSAERACAKMWIKKWLKEPRQLTYWHTYGLLSVMDMGVSDIVSAHGGDPQAYKKTLTEYEDLPDEESSILVAAALDMLEQNNG